MGFYSHTYSIHMLLGLESVVLPVTPHSPNLATCGQNTCLGGCVHLVVIVLPWGQGGALSTSNERSTRTLTNDQTTHAMINNGELEQNKIDCSSDCEVYVCITDDNP